MKVLELFSGTGSVGKICKNKGWDVVSLDIDGRADIKCNILEWDYKDYKQDEFDVVWASPPCSSFSILQYSWIGRNRNGKKFTREDVENDMKTKGDPIVQKTLEIIGYFNPKWWFIENPNTGNLKSRPYMKDLPYFIVDYCMYSDWGYRKRTRIWSNITHFEPKRCDGKGTCGNMIGRIHKTNLGNGQLLLRSETLLKHKNDVSGVKKRTTLDDRYRIPPKLIEDLLDV